jgi:hypothetical protein
MLSQVKQNLICGFCNKCFSDRSNAYNHRKKHCKLNPLHPEYVQHVPVPVPNNTFDQKKPIIHLKLEQQTKSVAPKRSHYLCRYCKLEFDNIETGRRHIVDCMYNPKNPGYELHKIKIATGKLESKK